MSIANRKTGSATVVRWTVSGGSVVTITGDHTKFGFKRKVDTVDVSAGSETTRSYEPTLENLDWTLTFFTALQAFLPDLMPRKEGLLEVLEDGVGAGKPIISFNTIITGFDQDYPFDGAQEITVTGMRQGNMIQEVGTVQS